MVEAKLIAGPVKEYSAQLRQLLTDLNKGIAATVKAEARLDEAARAFVQDGVRVYNPMLSTYEMNQYHMMRHECAAQLNKVIWELQKLRGILEEGGTQ